MAKLEIRRAVYEIRGIVGIKSKTVNFVTLRRKKYEKAI